MSKTALQIAEENRRRIEKEAKSQGTFKRLLIV